MTRLLFWIALAILVVMAVRSKIRAAMARAQQGGMPGGVHGAGPMPGMGADAGPAAGAGARAGYRRVEDTSERMASCARCGVYFPASEAVRAGGRDYCCPAHARQQAADAPDA